MNSFDFLRKLYRTSKCAVIVINSANTLFWSTGLEKLKLKEDDVRGKKSADIFGTPITKLLPGEYTLSISNKAYIYNVKSYSDRSNEFIIVEIMLESISNAVINDVNISNLMEKNTDSIKKNTSDIMAIVDKIQSNNNIVTDDDYSSIVQSARKLLNTNRNVISAIETKHEIVSKKIEPISISQLISQFADDCETVFKPKDVEVVLNCVEDIYAEVSNNAFYNLCLSILNRILCISDGYVDKIVLNLEMINDSYAEVSISSESASGKVRIANLDELKAKIEENDALDTDLFAIKYFCEKFHAEAVQRIDYENNSTLIKVKIPSCMSQGITLFKTNAVIPKCLDKFSKISVALSDVSII